ncbi:MAG: metallophosphoesterase [Nanoarchaeota archaeon]|nr:metallophosphoesterase [Nanoarchaeota archaeon]MBU4352349.1 metallophosphoesterase [Nanoarchaeota archaeon]
MKILAIGDPHGCLEKIKKIPNKKVDLILLTGDLGKCDLIRSMDFENIDRLKQGLPEKEFSNKQRERAFMQPYNSTMQIVRYLSKFAPVYTIFGNVENSNQETKKESKKIGIELPLLYDDLNSMHNVKVINNKIVNFQGIRIGGLKYFLDTNWVKDFQPSNYKKLMKRAEKETEKAKKVLKWFDSLDILLCHQPPYHILDKVTAKFAPKSYQGKHAGSKTILNYIEKKHPKYVICGHIHEQVGEKKVGKTIIYNLGVADYKLIEF